MHMSNHLWAPCVLAYLHTEEHISSGHGAVLQGLQTYAKEFSVKPLEKCSSEVTNSLLRLYIKHHFNCFISSFASIDFIRWPTAGESGLWCWIQHGGGLQRKPLLFWMPRVWTVRYDKKKRFSYTLLPRFYTTHCYFYLEILQLEFIF